MYKAQMISNDALLLDLKKTMPAKRDNKNDGVNFSDVLKNTAKTKNVNQQDAKSDEVQRPVNMSKRHIVSTSQVDKSDKGNEVKVLEEDNQVENTSSDTNPVLDGIAMLLGMDIKDLKDILTKLNISPESFLNVSDASKAMDKLNLALGMTNEQSEFLKSAVAKFANVVEEAAKNLYLSEQKNNLVEVEGVKVSLNLKSLLSDDSFKSKLSAEIKNIVENIKQDSGMMLSSINDKEIKQLDLFLNNSVLKDKLSIEKKEDKRVESKLDKYDAENNSSTEEESTEQVIKPTILQQDGGVNIAQKDNHSSFEHMHADVLKNTNANEDFSVKLAKTGTEIKTTRNQVMQQVFDKAKVMVDQHKSEMIMELKPESLGRLVLKIVTENGIVAAKFLAETQQVKDVIEANMQNLKESLQKQGLSIQDVSVSVGQDGRQDSQARQEFERRKQNKSNDGSGLVNTVGLEDELLERSNNNPYISNESSINVKV